MTTRIEMLNRALLRIGADPLQGEDDPGAPVHLAVYDSILDAVSGYPWSFFKHTRRLMRMAAAPTQHWPYAFQLPADRIGVPRSVFATGEGRQPITGYDIEGDKLLSAEPEIWITYTRLAPPALWPGDFREAFTVALMAELALSVREDRVLRDRLRQDVYGMPSYGGGLLDHAKAADSQGTPSTIVGAGVSPLIDARWS